MCASAEPDSASVADSSPAPGTGKSLRIVVLASGRGSNLAALIAASNAGTSGATIGAVFSDRADAGALAIAAEAGIAGRWFNPKAFENRHAFDRALFGQIDALEPDLIVCAGFMRILSADVVAARSQRIINIHPSLLPNYPGLHTHQRAIDAGDRVHGASVHFVIPALDAGPVIAQTRIAIQPGDDAAALSVRLLPAEHALLVAAIAKFSRHRIEHRDGQLRVDDQIQAPWQYDHGLAGAQ